MIAREHELHYRRWGRNLGLGLVLGAFVMLVFGLTVVKVSRQDENAIPHVGDAAAQVTP